MTDAKDYPNVDQGFAQVADLDTLFVVNKCDLVPVESVSLLSGCPALAVSALTGMGIEELLARLTGAVIERAGLSESPLLTQARHRRALEDCRDSLDRALAAGSVELLAEDLRLAVRAIGRVTGRVDVEDLLDVIFREFCIGK
jgi:tRNA modification GTPase